MILVKSLYDCILSEFSTSGHATQQWGECSKKMNCYSAFFIGPVGLKLYRMILDTSPQIYSEMSCDPEIRSKDKISNCYSACIIETSDLRLYTMILDKSWVDTWHSAVDNSYMTKFASPTPWFVPPEKRPKRSFGADFFHFFIWHSTRLFLMHRCAWTIRRVLKKSKNMDTSCICIYATWMSRHFHVLYLYMSQCACFTIRASPLVARNACWSLEIEMHPTVWRCSTRAQTTPWTRLTSHFYHLHAWLVRRYWVLWLFYSNFLLHHHILECSTL